MDKKLADVLDREIARVLPRVRELRHAIHACPEIAFDEHRTRAAVIKMIARTSISLRKPLIGTDIVADLAVRGAKKTVCLRADMDALPMVEETGVKYASRNKGFMHACGHDGHTAILAGTALVLSRLSKHLRANVRFVFQPGEELECCGSLLVKKGALRGVSEAYALHGWHGYPVGSVVCKNGVFFAANGTFYIVVRGKGTHGAMPEEGRNPIPVASEIVDKLDDLHVNVKRAYGAVISVCSINAGVNSNIIPERAVISGTTRFFTPRVGNALRQSIASIAAASGKRHGVNVHFVYESRYHEPVVNTDAGFAAVKEAAALAGERFIEAKKPLMASEDFAFYLTRNDGALFLLGLGDRSPKLHTPAFDFNDEAIEHGIRMFSRLLVS
ncbi:MAG: M20 family metallopeptidase [Spirochaetota bacterium]